MKTKTTILKMITLVICILLVLIAGVLPLIGGTRVLGLGFGQPGGRGITGQPPSGMIPPDGQGNPPAGFTPPQDGNFTGQRPNLNGAPGNFQGGFNGNSSTSGQLSTQMKLMRLLQYAVGGSVLLFGVITALGIALNKKWTRVWAVITSVITLAYSVPTMLRAFGTINLVEGIVKIVLAIALVMLVFIKIKPQSQETEAAGAA